MVGSGRGVASMWACLCETHGRGRKIDRRERGATAARPRRDVESTQRNLTGMAGCIRMSKTQMQTGAERTLGLLHEQVGRSIDEVETPVVILDLDRLEANLKELQSYADKHGVALWPH